MNAKSGKPKEIFLGSWINTMSPIVAEIMSTCGFDFLVVDAEHSAVDFEKCQLLFQAIKAGNPKCIPMVRMPGNQYQDTKRYLDAGATGVIAPLITTKKEAELLVKSVKYPPLGERGVGYGRSHGYGFSFNEYMGRANDETFVCVQIEHIDAIKNLDDIFLVPGINAAFVGPYDLSASMGLTAQFDHAEYKKVISKILKKCNEYNIIPGIHVVQPDPKDVLFRISEGFSMVAYSLDITMIGKACREGIKIIKKL
jgi:2-dehydro-3-deoxyglucarate aldolase